MPESDAVVPLTCPTYLSWLYQVERCFSKIQRDVIARGIFPSTKDLDKNHAPYPRAQKELQVGGSPDEADSQHDQIRDIQRRIDGMK